MAAAAVLNPVRRRSRFRVAPLLLAWTLGATTCWPLGVPASEPAAPRESMTLIDRYRDLNLVLMVAEGASREWTARLDPVETREESTTGDSGSLAEAALEPPVPVSELQKPLSRIVDQRQVVGDAARVFRFVRDHETELQTELRRIAAEIPEAISALDPLQLAEDALIIRSSLAASIEYLGRDGRPAWLDGLEHYHQKTLHLRNMMEYWTFDRELAAITDQALVDTGTRIEAYRRLLEVDPRLDAFTQHLRAVELIYRNQGKKVIPPEDPSEKLIEAASRVE